MITKEDEQKKKVIIIMFLNALRDNFRHMIFKDQKQIIESSLIEIKDLYKEILTDLKDKK